MKVRKWVELSEEVEVEVSVEDIRLAMGEAMEPVIRDRNGEEGPSINQVLYAINAMAIFLNAITDSQISMLKLGQLSVISAFLRKAADRFAVPETHT